MKNNIFSLRTLIIAAGIMPYALCLMPYTADAAVKRPNRAESYSKIGAMAAAAQYVDDTYYSGLPGADANDAGTTVTDTGVVLPVRVANRAMAEALGRGETYNAIGISNLESCAGIYPDGEFEWSTPMSGRGRGGAATCVAVVELRSVDPVPGGTEMNVTLARTTVAAGDSFKCNIDEFPEASWTEELGKITVPADNEPTREDVIKVLNQEQKQNAGFKIAALAVAGALGGNVAGKNEVGQEGLLGTGKEKMKSTAIGAVGGAALAVGNLYTGKVAGDMILSAGVNAAAGAAIGNMAATGDEVLRIEDCIVGDERQEKCLWGALVKGADLTDGVFYDPNSGDLWFCKAEGETDENAGSSIEGAICKKDGNMRSVTLALCPDDTIDNIDAKCRTKLDTASGDGVFRVEDVNGQYRLKQGADSNYKLVKAKAKRGGNSVAGALVLKPGTKDKFFGLKRSDWSKIREEYKDAKALRLRNSDGTVSEIPKEGEQYDIVDFYPMYISAQDGGIIDFGNKARLKGTLIGAGTGGAMGAFVGYEGAQSDIENRWVAEVRNYKDSLQKVYCITGNRFLSFYNDPVGIPELK